MRIATFAAALILASPVWAQDRWMTVPRPAPMPTEMPVA